MVKFTTWALVIMLGLLGPAAHGSEIVLLDFSSPFCGPCQQMKPTIDALARAGYPIRPVDVTAEPQLAAQYHVTQVPCFILLADGQELERMEGSTTSEELQGMFRRAAARPQPPAAAGVRAQSPDAPQPASQPAASPWMGVARQSRSDAVAADAQPAAFHRDPNSQLATVTTPPSTLDSPDELISASVRIRVDDPSGRSYGTGTIIDARSGEALVITCGHLFRESKGQGPVVVELFEMGPAGARVVGEVAGQVINYSLDRDVALVGIRPGRPVAVAPVAPPRTVVGRGDRVTSVGCDHGQDPTALATRVTALDRYQGPPNIEAAGAPVEGRSGGGLFNAQGQLVGICFAADYEGNEGLYAALEAIHDELNAAGLSDVCRPSADAVPSGSLVAAGPTGPPPVVRGQEPLQPLMPPAGRSGVMPVALNVDAGPGNAASGAPAGLSAAEQAAWEEIMRRAATSEVICIIRPKEPGGQSEVITLDDVSPEFVEALARRPRPGQAAARR